VNRALRAEARFTIQSRLCRRRRKLPILVITTGCATFSYSYILDKIPLRHLRSIKVSICV